MAKMRKLLTVVMDGVGHSEQVFGNAVAAASTPHLDALSIRFGQQLLYAHGSHVGLPSEKDMGNSEVGHNALGGGRVVDQGAKLVQIALDSGALFRGDCWKSLVGQLVQNNSTLHLIGLLSDGNVHSHESHLYKVCRQAAKQGVQKIRVHALLDGRDVPAKSAEVYAKRLELCLAELRQAGVDARVASGGGRMVTTMDRYESDWSVVERGWKAHVCGEAKHSFPSLGKAIEFFRKTPEYNDQNIPAFVIADKPQNPGPSVADGDAVVFFNFRGDRAVQISRAFTEEGFAEFERKHVPKVFFAGMMQYDGDLEVPKNYLVSPPIIDHCLSEIMIAQKIRQFACSETQKFGHVTFFWNGNRSGFIDEKYEFYQEIKSDLGGFEKKPEMKAKEITDATILALTQDRFDFGRINYANGDMVGHTGDFAATVKAVETVDREISRLWAACQKLGCVLVITADHGNADDMLQDKFDQTNNAHTSWVAENAGTLGFRPKTSHSLNPVPFLWCDPLSDKAIFPLPSSAKPIGSIGQLASSALKHFEVQVPDFYAKPLF